MLDVCQGYITTYKMGLIICFLTSCVTNTNRNPTNKKTIMMVTEKNRIPSFVLNKKDLAIILNCTAPSGRIYYHRLKRWYFTDDILEKIGITKERYDSLKGGKPFSVEESKNIAIHHGLLDIIIKNNVT